MLWTPWPVVQNGHAMPQPAWLEMHSVARSGYTRPPDLFLCPGTGAPGTPPRTCQAGAPNASIANDQDTYTTGVGVR
jgi:hypothetical protein